MRSRSGAEGVISRLWLPARFTARLDEDAAEVVNL